METKMDGNITNPAVEVSITAAQEPHRRLRSGDRKSSRLSRPPFLPSLLPASWCKTWLRVSLFTPSFSASSMSTLRPVLDPMPTIRVLASPTRQCFFPVNYSSSFPHLLHPSFVKAAMKCFLHDRSSPLISNHLNTPGKQQSVSLK